LLNQISSKPQANTQPKIKQATSRARLHGQSQGLAGFALNVPMRSIGRLQALRAGRMMPSLTVFYCSLAVFYEVNQHVTQSQ